MPLPLPPQISKPETKNFQSSKIVPSDDEQSKKTGENYHAEISPPSPQGTIKQRSAFEDLTNASQSQPVQSKKKANKEFVKYVSKRINGSTYALESAKNNGRKRNRDKLEVSPVVVSTSLVPNIMEKLPVLDISTKSKTPPTEEACIFEKLSVLREEPAVQETTLIKKALKQCTNHGELSLLEKSLPLQEETDNENEFGIEPVTFGKKPKTEESSLTKKILSLKKKCTPQGKSSYMVKPLVLQKITSEEKSLTKVPLSFKTKPTEEYPFWKPPALQEKYTTEQEVSVLKKSLALQEKINFEEDSLFKQSLAFKKKPTTKEATLITKQLFLKEKCTTEGKKGITEVKRYCLKKSLVLQEVTSEEKSLITEPSFFEKNPTIQGESWFKEPSSLKEKNNIQREEVGILKRKWASWENMNSEDNLCMELVTCKKQHITMEKPSLLIKKCNTLGKSSHFRPLLLHTVTSGDKSLTKEPLSFKKSTTEKDLLFQGSSAFQEKCTTPEQVFTFKNLVLQKSPTEEKSHFQDALAFKKQCIIEEASPTEKLLPLKKLKCTTQGTVSYLKPPVLQIVAFGEKSPSKESLSFKEENVLLKKKKYTTQAVPFWQELSDCQEISGEVKDSFVMEPVPFRKKPTTEEEFLFQEPSSLKEKHSTLQGMSLSEKSLALQEKTITKVETYSKEPGTLKEKPTIEEEFFFKEQFSLSEKLASDDVSHFLKDLGLQKEAENNNDTSKKLLTLQEKSTTKEEFLFKKFLVCKKEPSTEAATNPEKQLSLKKSTFQCLDFLSKKQLALCEETTNDESLIKQPLALQVYPSIKNTVTLKNPEGSAKPLALQKSSTRKKPLILQRNSTVKKESVLKEHTINKEAHFMKLLTLPEKSNTEKEGTLKEPLTLQKKPRIEKEAIFQKPLAFQKKTNTDKAALSDELLVLTDEVTGGKQLSFKYPLLLEQNPAHKEDTFLIPQVESSSHVFSNALESGTSTSNIVNISVSANLSTIRKFRAFESGSRNHFSSQKRRARNQKTILDDIDKDYSDQLFNSIYSEDIFSYMKEREEKFILKNYMNRQIDITSEMRAILVDWLVEVQITFGMSHETLYLAVKLVDHYLMKALCNKDKLQLLGSTAFLIAAKFEEPCPPSVGEFLYICEDLYPRKEMLAMEVSILKTLEFDINIPIAYHFLRRYAICLQTNMKTLTLSRFICEITLQEYEYIHERASKLAAGSFLLALYMNKLGHWAPILEYYSGYNTSELHSLVRQLNILLNFQSYERLKTVYNKYSHQIFFEVTKIPTLDILKLEEILSCQL
ncbi:G2/mitotic-specific cyclin-B3 isoform X2 [Castor canadensis]|uniref:G2/mitotic-specific cyclin-B3 isoform X2 n=1 Tax=Castor canadensis TaxID=51338 RepID=A0AC58LNI8_CASCN